MSGGDLAHHLAAAKAACDKVTELSERSLGTAAQVMELEGVVATHFSAIALLIIELEREVLKAHEAEAAVVTSISMLMTDCREALEVAEVTAHQCDQIQMLIDVMLEIDQLAGLGNQFSQEFDRLQSSAHEAAEEARRLQAAVNETLTQRVAPRQGLHSACLENMPDATYVHVLKDRVHRAASQHRRALRLELVGSLQSVLDGARKADEKISQIPNSR